MNNYEMTEEEEDEDDEEVAVCQNCHCGAPVPDVGPQRHNHHPHKINKPGRVSTPRLHGHPFVAISFTDPSKITLQGYFRNYLVNKLDPAILEIVCSLCMILLWSVLYFCLNYVPSILVGVA